MQILNSFYIEINQSLVYFLLKRSEVSLYLFQLLMLLVDLQKPMLSGLRVRADEMVTTCQAVLHLVDSLLI